jgi:predicted NBD/HSP70 family sugar kinase
MGKGSNSAGLRRYNERVIMTALRNMGSASKSELAKAVNLTPQALTRIIDELDRVGLVSRRGRRLGGKGQPSIMYSIDPQGAYSIGVKVGRSDLEMLLMDFGGEIIARMSHPYNVPEPAFLLPQIKSGIEELSAKVPPGGSGKLFGVGIAMPWFIGAWTREIEMSDSLAAEWNSINFEEEVEKLTELPVFFENDCSAAAIAELSFGRGADIGNFLYVFIGTFVGGGVVLQGKLEAGSHGNAGALASMPVPPSKLSSVPPPEGAFEALLNRASLFALRRHLAANGIKLNRVAHLHTVLDEARPLVQEWLDDCADALVFAMLSAVGVLDTEAIVIDGYLPTFLLDELVAMVRRRIQAQSLSGVFEPKILRGSVGGNAVAYGGAILPFYANFVPDKAILLKGGIPARALV